MEQDTVTIKVWTETRKLLRLISAMTGETILEVVQRLASSEWSRLRDDTGAQDSIESDN